MQLLCQCFQNEIGALGNADFGQDCYLVAEGGIHVEQPLVLGNGSIETMTPLRIGHVDFWPRRSKKNAVMITMRLSDSR